MAFKLNCAVNKYTVLSVSSELDTDTELSISVDTPHSEVELYLTPGQVEDLIRHLKVVIGQ